MTDPEQPTIEDEAPRGADPNRVIDKLTQQVAALSQQAAIAQVLIEERDERNAELRQLVNQLRAELVAASSGQPAPPAKAAPARGR